VGHFAVAPAALAANDPDATFTLFVAFAMFQARRDAVIMTQQRRMPLEAARSLASRSVMRSAIAASRCPSFESAERFDSGCSVRKAAGVVDCAQLPGASCHVKTATLLLNRTGDMGRMPSGAWLHLWSKGQLHKELARLGRERKEVRGELLIRRLRHVHRIGEKLATMFVAALSTPALAPGLTPWYPLIDGNELVVVDTNVARAADTLGAEHRTYEARAAWVRAQAKKINLRQYRDDLPKHSPRLVQQALFAFGSRSNRIERRDPCSQQKLPCERCAPAICPFGR
jgi:hypothetical protein